MSTNGAIYETIVKNCDPYTLKLGGPIDGVVADFFKSPEDPKSLTGKLATKFNQQQLQDAGVLRKKVHRDSWGLVP